VSSIWAQIHGWIKRGILDGYPSSALLWLPEGPSDILSIFPFLSDSDFEPFSKKLQSIWQYDDETVGLDADSVDARN
jgi:hypothetical protein